MYPQSQIRFVLILALLGLAVSCGQAQGVAPTGDNTASLTISPPVDSKPRIEPRADAGTSKLTLGPADVIRVSVWKNPDLSQTVTVGPDGFVSLPLLGDVHVAGLTTNQLAQVVTSRLSTYVVSAQVTVSLVEIRSRQVYVVGQVGKPGGYPLITPMTVLQLIAQAGGLNTFANRKTISVLRETNGEIQRLSFNYVEATHGDSKQSIRLQPGDTVVVP